VIIDAYDWIGKIWNENEKVAKQLVEIVQLVELLASIRG